MKFPDVKFVQTDATREALTAARTVLEALPTLAIAGFVCTSLSVNRAPTRDAAVMLRLAIMDELNGQAHRSLRLWIALHNDGYTFDKLTPEFMRTYRLAWIDHMLQNR